MIPSAAIIVASTMNATKLKDSSALSEVWNSTVSHTTASAGEPTADSSARRAASETIEEMGSSTIDPSRSSPSSRSVATTTLASSRATSQRMRSPSGRSAASRRRTTLIAEGWSRSTR